MKRNFICQLFLICAIAFSGAMSAQTVKGTVSDKAGPLPMVTVMIKGTNTNAVSDINGEYTFLEVPANAVLVFSYIGYQTKEVAVNGQPIVNVVLADDAQQLNEVVVTGYSSQQKKSISGAIVQVDLEDMSKTRVPDVTQALQGQAAGVFVAASSGAPGDGIQIRIRGQGTLGNNDVLYVVDGVPTRSIGFIPGGDIKNLTVLKDAASASIYGSRAANGVVLITTKKGQDGKGTFEAEAFTGVHFVTNLPKLLNTSQYLDVMETSYNNTTGNDPALPNPYTSLRGRSDLSDTDWLDELFTTGYSNSAHVSASGGSDKLSYYISGGYFGVDGVVVENNDKYKRANFRTNVLGHVSERFTVGSNLQLTFIKQDKLSSTGDAPGVIRHAMIRPPVLGVYKDPSDPTWSADDPYTDLPFYIGPDNFNKFLEYSSNPIAIVHFTNDKRELFNTFGNVFAEYAFLGDKSLKFKTLLGVDAKFIHNKRFAQNYGDQQAVLPDDSPYIGMGRNNMPNNLSEDRGQDVTFNWSNTFNYIKTFGDHSINALVGTEYITNKYEQMGGTRSAYDITLDPFLYLDYGQVGGGTTGLPPAYAGGSGSAWTLFSYFGTATYGFKEKLFATATVRADASSRFGPNKKWGYFPSVSANYILTNEDFMKDVTWLNSLKIRASYGKNGNQEIPNYAYQNRYVNTPNGPQLARLGNPNLQWETTTQTNVGLDFTFLSNKLYFSADYFIKDTDDILLSVTLPATSVGQLEPSYFNTASVRNKGFEFALGYQNNDRDFKYGFNANVATLSNNVTKLYTYVPNLDDPINYTRSVVGQPINAYYGYQFVGIYQNQSEIDTHLFADAGTTQPGDMKFRDVNGDGRINANDRTHIGNPIPEVTYGVNLNMSYKGFDISCLFQGVSGVDRYNDLKQILDYDSRPFNSTTAVLNAWDGEGTSNTMPRLTFNPNGSERISSAMVEDASYLRLKNLEIGYTFNKVFKAVDNLRIYVSGQNLVTWTNYSGLDPESTLVKDQGTYPQMTSVIFGAKIKL
ncbi:TonB-dependent receptor [Flavobacterium sp.]|uniref:SusC/RagA family TonB-linked outer membrane protein n=1 Tax=Flavobacterium sp. TaxID=239 RepID=UPI001218BCFC|nr:TonB-dependent receptor [Flavobacterium sp.]RZJ70608.1 MAG: TonB-dependent receptor [Flavobacterium sp.]